MTIKAYDSAYPGSMFLRDDGNYIERTDIDSLVAALVEAVRARDRTIEDLEGALEQMKEDARAREARSDS